MRGREEGGWLRLDAVAQLLPSQRYWNVLEDTTSKDADLFACSGPRSEASAALCTRVRQRHTGGPAWARASRVVLLIADA